MLPIEKQIKRDFLWLLKQKETPEVTIAYDLITDATTKEFYGNQSGTVTSKTVKAKAVMDILDEWKVKKLPYMDLKVGQTIFYIDQSTSLTNATNIKVTWSNRVWPISSVENAIPLGSGYLCKALISSE